MGRLLVIKKKGKLSSQAIRYKTIVLKNLQERMKQDEKTIKLIKSQLAAHLTAVKLESTVEGDYKIHWIRPTTKVWDEAEIDAVLADADVQEQAIKKGILEPDESLHDAAITTTTKVNENVIEELIQQGIIPKKWAKKLFSVRQLTAYVRVDNATEDDDE